MATLRSQAANPEADSEGGGGSSTHHSLGLKHALRRFRAAGGSRVLDLGPAQGRNVQFLSPFASKLFIADLSGTISRQPELSSLERKRLEQTLQRDLPPVDEAPVDLVLGWDLLNYLDREQVSVLGRHLARLCRTDSQLFVLVSNRPEVPESPGRYLILDAETLRYENHSSRTRTATGYKEPDLERLLPAFEVETSFLLRSGIQEYVLTPRPAV